MKYSYLLIMMFVPLFFSCSKDNKIQEKPNLTLSPDSLGFDYTGGEKSIALQTNAEKITASLSGGSEWITYKINGASVSITVQPLSSGAADRSSVLTVYATKGDATERKGLKITQKAQTLQWELVWEDNFNVDGPVDPAKWTLVDKGTPDWKKYMTPTNEMAFVQGGNLILKGIKTAIGYQTGGVDTYNKFSFKYGKIEVKAKLSAGQGTWPAIWMMPQQSVYGGWPKSGEIDIMEHINSDSKVYQVIHSHYVDNLGQKTNPPYSSTPAFNVGQFNTFGIEWFPDKIDFFVNGAKTFTYPKKTDIPSDQLQWPFDQSFYIILNQALGGSWVGTINDAVLPVQTEIDYVKVYQYK